MAVKMTFLPGAVIQFALSCPISLPTAGRVVEVTEDTVVFVPQGFVLKKECDMLCRDADGNIDYHKGVDDSKINQNITINDGPEVHLDRRYIVGWQYAVLNTFSDVIYHKFTLHSDAEVNPDNLCHYNHISGICYGRDRNSEPFERTNPNR